MRIVLKPGLAPRLEGASDFRSFSIALDPRLQGDLRTAAAPVGHAEGDHVWVRPDAVRALCATAGDGAWSEGFAAMVSFAKAHGWVDPSGCIRAHVELLDEPAPVSVDAFRQAMRRFASGVCIVAAGEGDQRIGMTVSAFSSVSAEPPLVLVCLNRSAGSHDSLVNASSYAINILGAEQEEEAMLFAGQRGLHGADRFGLGWQQSDSGAPVLTSAHHTLVCQSEAQHPAGSHTVLIGRVIDIIPGRGTAALVNYDGAMGVTSHAA
ncbi:flavin reductase [Pseudooceanicola sediminis]|uniref:Flavin reductase n=1 Tax=Pseudooceanicola sediminis TaxID=2211117 RepID=A0A399J0F7_9RHOB|nr:flavin reductase family protein [Pseudooceanicola sediminis]KAA2315088.1 flavin reductase [Puniceibacterium sp. HSS470]RII38903.1 flavin reductase [Pseudooceanicola sediminis]|tara:strand:- start:34741 stop:35535 length:795 start_codon:yes stop_codon:yes gene_type:complete